MSNARTRPAVTAERPGRDLARPLPAALSWTVLIGFATVFAGVSIMVGLAWWVCALYGAASVVAFAAYWLDKRAARRGTWRASEQTLLLMGLVGGWPGALVAQQLFRHKTRKRTFRRAFWGTVALNVLAFGLYVGLILTLHPPTTTM